MPFKATLKIILKADETIVAESEDSKLWQDILAAINIKGTLITENPGSLPNRDNNKDKDPIQLFANEIGVEKKVLIGACSPSFDKPFIHLDKHYWEAVKKGLPERGKKAISDVAIAGTMLVLWKEKAKLGDTLQIEIAKVLGTIGATPNNPKRSIENCEWLQLRGEKVTINPSQTSKAINIVKAYCLKTDPGKLSDE